MTIKQDGGSAVAVGNAFDGMTFYGPFEDDHEAFEWADQNIVGEEWHTVPLEPPSQV